jgi:hypothetical protein
MILGTSKNSLRHCGLDPQSPKFQEIPALADADFQFAGMTSGIFRSSLNSKFPEKKNI